MKKSLWTRLLSLLLAVVLCVELLPAVGSAVSPSEDLEHTVEGTVEEPAEVAFEEASLRGERVKHFRMGDGSYVAVQYDVPVHHQDADGQWQDIDNTLEPVGQTYAVEDGSGQSERRRRLHGGRGRAPGAALSGRRFGRPAQSRCNTGSSGADGGCRSS